MSKDNKLLNDTHPLSEIQSVVSIYIQDYENGLELDSCLTGIEAFVKDIIDQRNRGIK